MDSLMSETYKIRLYRPSDLYKVKNPYPILSNQLPIVYSLSEYYGAKGLAFTGYSGNHVIGCCGIVKLWDGHGEAWLLADSSITNHSKWAYRHIKTMMQQVIDNMDLNRVQAAVKKDFPASIRFVEKLGFKAEGEMPEYFLGETHVRYAKVRNNHV